MSGFWSRVPRWALARRATALAFLALLGLGAKAGGEWLVGSTSASTAFGVVPFVDPLAALEVTLATREWVPTVALGAGSLMLTAVVLGPIFCGWVCPLGLLLDLVGSLRGRLERTSIGRSLGSFTLPRSTRMATLGLALGFSAFGRMPVFEVLSPIHAVTRAVVHTADGALLAVVLLALVELVAAPRLWCRALCPLGGLYSLLATRASFRIRVGVEPRGAGCGLCSRSCPMGIRVMEDYSMVGKTSIDDPDCTRCGACVDVCPREVLTVCPQMAAPASTEAV